MAGFEIKALILLGLALVSFGANGASIGARRGLADAGVTVFDITKYGAKPDGKTESAQAIIKAWNEACKSSAAAKLVVPTGSFAAGEIVIQGPCTAPKPITIEIQGTLLGRTDLSLYTTQTWISIEHVDGLIVTGGGTINGQGEASWRMSGCKSGDSCDKTGGALLPDRMTTKTACIGLPFLSIVFMRANNSVMRGLNLVNSKGFHMKVVESTNVTVEDVHITAPGDSPNTDGIHIGRASLVNVTNSVIGTGDDCISIGDGSTDIGITNVTCGPGHGISIGSLGRREGETDVKGITVRNCTLSNTTNGARIKTFRESPKLQVSSVLYEDIVMNDVANPIIIDQNYNSKRKSGVMIRYPNYFLPMRSACTIKLLNSLPLFRAFGQGSNVKITDVHFKNIRGTSVTPVAVALRCSDVAPCEGLELADIDFTFSGKSANGAALSSACANAKADFKGKMNPSACA
ncbi:hypothetical protein RJ639_018699 [Escallonia herrerae]|uniref:Glycoside hydrolase family 28 n=1 Tax=Escallonia herrerae TaxID=1293975 RepID=A0AA88VBI9_9ASTE|nr:hypothetical protein RJ639_018699 [Escallonia herrerae]